MSAVTDADLSTVSHLLEPGEVVRWIGQPAALAQMRGALPVSFFGLFFGGFALFWMAAASGFTFGLDGGAGLFPLFGLPFFLVGLLMALAPLFVWRKARRTLYLVTDRRALVASPGSGGMTIQAVPAPDLEDLTITVRRDGSGTIQFGPAPALAAEGATPRTRLAFTNAPEVLVVKALLDDLRSARAPLPLPGLADDTADLDAGDETSDARALHPPGWNLARTSGT